MEEDTEPFNGDRWEQSEDILALDIPVQMPSAIRVLQESCPKDGFNPFSPFGVGGTCKLALSEVKRCVFLKFTAISMRLASKAS